jgi:hypothetical protein
MRQVTAMPMPPLNRDVVYRLTQQSQVELFYCNAVKRGLLQRLFPVRELDRAHADESNASCGPKHFFEIILRCSDATVERAHQPVAQWPDRSYDASHNYICADRVC